MIELFGDPQKLWLLALIPVAALAGWISGRLRRKALAALAGSMPPRRLVPGLWPAGRTLRSCLFLAGTSFCLMALARPQWGERAEPVVRRGVDIVLALDTSRSMACEDVKPSRFERARLAVADLLRTRAGDRIALLPFTQQASVACPLTLDYAALRLFLDAAEVGIDGTPGTDLAQAIRSAGSAFERGEKKYKVIILLSDGEDHGSDAVAAAKEAGQQGIVVYAVGVGTPGGGPIPERDENGSLLGYHRGLQGRVVTTRLDEELLEKVCFATGGKAFQLGATGEEINRIADEIDKMDKKEQKGILASRKEERYRWPLAVALALLTAEVLVPRRRSRAGSWALLLFMFLIGTPSPPLHAEGGPGAGAPPPGKPGPARKADFGVARLNREGNRLYSASRFEEALDRYTRAQVSEPDLPPLRYNIGNVLYRQGRYAEAMEEYRRAAPADSAGGKQEDPLAADAAHNLGNAYFRMGKYREAADAYARSLVNRPSDRETKRNLELALRKLQEQRRTQQKRKSQEQQKQDQEQQRADSPQQGTQKQQAPQQRQQMGQSSEKQDEKQAAGRRDEKEKPAAGASDASNEEQPSSSGENRAPSEGKGSERQHEKGRFTQQQAQKLLDALAGDEARALRRLMRPQGNARTKAVESGEDW